MRYSLKKLFFLILFIPLIHYANTIESIAYQNEELVIQFSDKNIKYTQSYDKDITSTLSFKFKNTKKSPKVQELITIDDVYLGTIITETYDNETDLVLYLRDNTDYSIGQSNNKMIISLKNKKIKPKKKYTIILDAGHGGHDSGALGGENTEKELALAVITELYKELKDDYNIILTRKDDTFIPLNERAKIGNDNEADLFVSIHLNASRNKGAHGSEVFYFSKNPSRYARDLSKFEDDFDQKGAKQIAATNFVINDIVYHFNQQHSAILATRILDELVQEMHTERRKATGANFAVLRGSNSPSVLIELGFITNDSDRAKYNNKEGQRRAAEAIARAIRKQYN